MQSRRRHEENPMNKRLYPAMIVALLVLLLADACSSLGQMPIPPSGKPLLGGPTNADVGTVPANEPAATVANAAVQQAPICQATTSCAALNAEQIPLDCVKKVPYTNVLVPPGTTFQVMDNSGDFACIDSGVVVNGKQVLTCHGTQLYSFQLKLSNSSCGSYLQRGTGKCVDGYGYDAANQCCAPLGTNGSTTVSVNLGACPLPNP
jgi:hypothetical protein